MAYSPERWNNVSVDFSGSNNAMKNVNQNLSNVQSIADQMMDREMKQQAMAQDQFNKDRMFAMEEGKYNLQMEEANRIKALRDAAVGASNMTSQGNNTQLMTDVSNKYEALANTYKDNPNYEAQLQALNNSVTNPNMINALNTDRNSLKENMYAQLKAQNKFTTPEMDSIVSAEMNSRFPTATPESIEQQLKIEESLYKANVDMALQREKNLGRSGSGSGGLSVDEDGNIVMNGVGKTKTTTSNTVDTIRLNKVFDDVLKVKDSKNLAGTLKNYFDLGDSTSVNKDDLTTFAGEMTRRGVTQDQLESALFTYSSSGTQPFMVPNTGLSVPKGLTGDNASTKRIDDFANAIKDKYPTDNRVASDNGGGSSSGGSNTIGSIINSQGQSLDDIARTYRNNTDKIRASGMQGGNIGKESFPEFFNQVVGKPVEAKTTEGGGNTGTGSFKLDDGTTKVRDTSKSLTEDFNNPGALKYANPSDKSVRWKGQVGVDDSGHAIFDNAENGARAQVINAYNQIEKGKFENIQQYINNYAEGNQKEYATFVSKELGLKPTDKLTTAMIGDLAYAQSKFEGGKFAKETFTKGYNSAVADGKVPGSLINTTPKTDSLKENLITKEKTKFEQEVEDRVKRDVVETKTLKTSYDKERQKVDAELEAKFKSGELSPLDNTLRKLGLEKSQRDIDNKKSKAVEDVARNTRVFKDKEVRYQAALTRADEVKQEAKINILKKEPQILEDYEAAWRKEARTKGYIGTDIRPFSLDEYIKDKYLSKGK